MAAVTALPSHLDLPSCGYLPFPIPALSPRSRDSGLAVDRLTERIRAVLTEELTGGPPIMPWRGTWLLAHQLWLAPCRNTRCCSCATVLMALIGWNDFIVGSLTLWVLANFATPW